MMENVTGVYYYGSTICNVYNIFINDEILKRLILTHGDFYKKITSYTIDAIRCDSNGGVNLILPLILTFEDEIIHPDSNEQFHQIILESLSVFSDRSVMSELIDIITESLKHCSSTDIRTHHKYTTKMA